MTQSGLTRLVSSHPSATMVPMSTATTTVNFDPFLPSSAPRLKDFQHVGIAYALANTQDGKGTWIADEQGLGKTVQAITASVVHLMVHNPKGKVLIICKSALKGVWQRELARFAPQLDVQILGGRKPYETTSQVCLINFDVLAAWKSQLVKEGFQVMVIDESHYVKEIKTQRTKAALEVARDIRSRRGMVLLLSGTPLLNRPVELVTQLMIMGRLQDIAPRPEDGKSWAKAFKRTFCDMKWNGYAWEAKGAKNLDLLNTRMRGNCMIRRLRKNVLDMAETERYQVPLNLNGGLNEYRRIEETFQPKHPASEALELLGALRQAVELAKIPAAVEWVEDFLADNEEQRDPQTGQVTQTAKKLVVWATHIPAQVETARALNAAGVETVLLREATTPQEIEAAKARFNEGSARVIVCSLAMHREGHTLLGDGTNVTDSLFLSQPWHPGAVSQAEDRISRIGRTAEAVFAWTLICPDTVDEWLATLIAEKWATFRAAADGTISEAEEGSIRDALLTKLRDHMRAKYGRSPL